MLNEVPLEIHYEISTEELVVQEQTLLEVPLIEPWQTSESSRVVVYSEQSIRTSLENANGSGVWTSEEYSESEVEEEGQIVGKFFSIGNPAEISLQLQPQVSEQSELVTLERAWVQTWIVDDKRQDRAVFLFQPAGNRIAVNMPVEARGVPLEVVLDGQLATYQWAVDRQLLIEVPDRTSFQKLTLEIRYQRQSRLGNLGDLQANFPRPVSDNSFPEVFWQVVLPEGWLVGKAPAAFAGEYWVGWQDTRWGRHPTISQPELEKWASAKTLLPPPPSAREYVFRSWELPASARVTIFRELWVASAAAILVFVGGVLACYTSLVRLRVFWLVCAVGLFMLVGLLPEFALLAVQAIVLGAVMVLTTVLLRRVFQPEPIRDSLLRPSTITASAMAHESWSQQPTEHADLRESTTASLQTSGPQS